MTTDDSPSILVISTTVPGRLRVRLASDPRREYEIVVDPADPANLGVGPISHEKLAAVALEVVLEWDPRFQFPPEFPLDLLTRCFPELAAAIRARLNP